MFQSIDQMKYNKRDFRNETEFYVKRYQTSNPRPLYMEQSVQASVNAEYQQQFNQQHATRPITRIPHEEKFITPVMQTPRSSIAHNKSKCASIGNVNSEKWMAATMASCAPVVRTPIRGQFIRTSNHIMEENDLMNQSRASPRLILGATNIDDSMMSNLIINENQKHPATNMDSKLYGTSEKEKMFVFTGTVERAIKWNMIFRNHVCYSEVIASVLSIEEGSVKSQMIMLLRDKKGGPILQMVYHTSTHLALQDFYIGQMLRCVGRMNGRNILNAVSIRAATPGEVENLQRLCCVCDQAVSQHYLNI